MNFPRLVRMRWEERRYPRCEQGAARVSFGVGLGVYGRRTNGAWPFMAASTLRILLRFEVAGFRLLILLLLLIVAVVFAHLDVPPWFGVVLSEPHLLEHGFIGVTSMPGRSREVHKILTGFA